MPLRLPPLPALRLFEAAGRHLSFKRAAAELNLTPSAVSHGIVGLEEALGVALFVRGPRGISLTPEGAVFLPYVAEAFALIATGTQRLPGNRIHRAIAVSCAPTFAARWLLPRLARFRERQPHTDVSVDTSRRQVGFPVDGFDFAVRMSRAPAADAGWTRLFGERLVPVCSPAYRAALGGEAFDLARATLIHVEPAGEDWEAWLARAGVEGVDATRGVRVDAVQLAFEAAAAGLGVAIGRRPLVDRDLDAGTLVAAGPELAAETAYWLVAAPALDSRPDLAAFRDWLVAETAAWREDG